MGREGREEVCGTKLWKEFIEVSNKPENKAIYEGLSLSDLKHSRLG